MYHRPLPEPHRAPNLRRARPQLASAVTERERGLRQALATAGMLDSAFWGSWLVVELLIGVVFALLMCGFGAMFGFAFFLKNSFAVVSRRRRSGAAPCPAQRCALHACAGASHRHTFFTPALFRCRRLLLPTPVPPFP
jgi:hypothetical protein